MTANDAPVTKSGKQTCSTTPDQKSVRKTFDKISTHVQGCANNCIPAYLRPNSKEPKSTGSASLGGNSAVSPAEKNEADIPKFKLLPAQERRDVGPWLRQTSPGEAILNKTNTTVIESNEDPGCKSAASDGDSWCGIAGSSLLSSETTGSFVSNSKLSTPNETNCAAAQIEPAFSKSIPPSERPAGYCRNSKRTTRQQSNYNNDNSSWTTRETPTKFAEVSEDGTTRDPTPSLQRNSREDNKTERKPVDETTQAKISNSKSDKSWLAKVAQNDSSDEDAVSISSKDSNDDILVNPTETQPLTFAPTKTSSSSSRPEDETAAGGGGGGAADPTNSNSPWFKPCSESDKRAAKYLINDTESNPYIGPSPSESKDHNLKRATQSKELPKSGTIAGQAPTTTTTDSTTTRTAAKIRDGTTATHSRRISRQLGSFLARRDITMQDWEDPFLDEADFKCDAQGVMRVRADVKRKWGGYVRAGYALAMVRETNLLVEDDRGWGLVGTL